jgi:omega-6 fatty acid desaturase (delta-12 desaturase)
VFLLENRLPVGFMRKGPTPWLSTMTTNAGILLAAGLLIQFVGFTTFLIVHMSIVVLAATMGVWVFYVQHQFEATTWDGASDWRQPEAALHGSSYYDLPLVLRWFSANIGVHHVHHLSSAVPFYRLPEVLRTFPELRDVSRLTLWRSLVCARLALWDEETRRLLSFREAQAKRGASQPSEPKCMTRLFEWA